MPRFIGASYLFYLGVRLLISEPNPLILQGAKEIPRKKLFFSGAFSNISNPNVTIFYFAFLPQFIPETATNPTQLLLLLGGLFALLTFLVKGPVGYFAGILSRLIRSHPRIPTVIDRVSGTLMIGLGLRLAPTQQK